MNNQLEQIQILAEGKTGNRAEIKHYIKQLKKTTRQIINRYKQIKSTVPPGRLNDLHETFVSEYEEVIDHIFTLYMDLRACYQNNKNVEELDKQHEYKLDFSKTAQEMDAAKQGCFIATAVFGREMAYEVQALKKWRDTVLKKSLIGRAFISSYYTLSPWLVRNVLKNSPRLKKATRFGLEIFVTYYLNKKENKK